MSFLCLLIALVCENFLPEDRAPQLKQRLRRIDDQFQVDMAALGAPKLVWLNWLFPLCSWMLLYFIMASVLGGLHLLLVGLLDLIILLILIHFRLVVDVLTQMQLFLNQGDFYRAKELLLNRVKQYDGSELHIHGQEDLIFQAICYTAELALRQLFCLMFWFMILPGAAGVLLYALVWRAVLKDRQQMNTLHWAHEHPTLNDLWQQHRIQAVLDPRFALYVLEWLPSRLLGLAVGLVSQLDDVTLAWRQAAGHTRFSNRAPLTAAFLAATGALSVFTAEAGQSILSRKTSASVKESSWSSPASEPVSLAEVELSQSSGAPVWSDSQVMALQQCRSLMLRCMLVWMVFGLIVSLLGWSA